MPDGTRKRRTNGQARQTWYAMWRSARFNRRIGMIQIGLDDLLMQLAGGSARHAGGISGGLRMVTFTAK